MTVLQGATGVGPHLQIPLMSVHGSNCPNPTPTDLTDEEARILTNFDALCKLLEQIRNKTGSMDK